MTIKTFDDIQSIQQVHCETHEIGASDLRREAETLDANGVAWECWQAGAYNSEGLTILFVPSVGRAGVAWGADADWTDASSAADALERYFGVDGKEMVE